MAFDQDIKELLALMVKMVSSDIGDKILAYNRAKETVKRIKREHDLSTELLNDLSGKILKLSNENKAIKQELAFIKIAAGEELEEELSCTLHCMNKAVEYVENSRYMPKGE